MNSIFSSSRPSTVSLCKAGPPLSSSAVSDAPDGREKEEEEEFLWRTCGSLRYTPPSVLNKEWKKRREEIKLAVCTASTSSCSSCPNDALLSLVDASGCTSGKDEDSTLDLHCRPFGHPFPHLRTSALFAAEENKRSILQDPHFFGSNSSLKKVILYRLRMLEKVIRYGSRPRRPSFVAILPHWRRQPLPQGLVQTWNEGGNNSNNKDDDAGKGFFRSAVRGEASPRVFSPLPSVMYDCIHSGVSQMLSILRATAIRAQQKFSSSSSSTEENVDDDEEDRNAWTTMLGSASFQDFFFQGKRRKNLSHLYCLLETLRLEMEDVWSQGIPEISHSFPAPHASSKGPKGCLSLPLSKEEVWRGLVKRCTAAMDAFEWTVVSQILLFFEFPPSPSPSSCSMMKSTPIPEELTSSGNNNNNNNDKNTIPHPCYSEDQQDNSTRIKKQEEYATTSTSSSTGSHPHDHHEHSCAYGHHHFHHAMEMMEIFRSAMAEEQWPSQLLRSAPSSSGSGDPKAISSSHSSCTFVSLDRSKDNTEENLWNGEERKREKGEVGEVEGDIYGQEAQDEEDEIIRAFLYYFSSRDNKTMRKRTRSEGKDIIHRVCCSNHNKTNNNSNNNSSCSQAVGGGVDDCTSSRLDQHGDFLFSSALTSCVAQCKRAPENLEMGIIQVKEESSGTLVSEEEEEEQEETEAMTEERWLEFAQIRVRTRLEIQQALRDAEDTVMGIGVSGVKKGNDTLPTTPPPLPSSRSSLLTSNHGTASSPSSSFSCGPLCSPFLVEGTRVIAMSAFYTLLEADNKNIFGGAARPALGVLASRWRDAQAEYFFTSPSSSSLSVCRDSCHIPPPSPNALFTLLSSVSSCSSSPSPFSTLASSNRGGKILSNLHPLLYIMGLVWAGAYTRLGLLRVMMDVQAVFLQWRCLILTEEEEKKRKKRNKEGERELLEQSRTGGTTHGGHPTVASSISTTTGGAVGHDDEEGLASPSSSPLSSLSSSFSTSSRVGLLDIQYLWNVWQLALQTAYHAYMHNLVSDGCPSRLLPAIPTIPVPPTSCLSSSSTKDTAPSSFFCAQSTLFTSGLNPPSIFDILEDAETTVHRTPLTTAAAPSPHPSVPSSSPKSLSLPSSSSSLSSLPPSIMCSPDSQTRKNALTAVQRAGIRVVTVLSELKHNLPPPVGGGRGHVDTESGTRSPTSGGSHTFGGGEVRSLTIPPPMRRINEGERNTPTSSSSSRAGISFSSPFTFFSSLPNFTCILLWISRRSFTLRRSRMDAFTAIRVVLDHVVDRYIQEYGPTHPNSKALTMIRQKFIHVAKQERLL